MTGDSYLKSLLLLPNHYVSIHAESILCAARALKLIAYYSLKSRLETISDSVSTMWCEGCCMFGTDGHRILSHDMGEHCQAFLRLITQLVVNLVFASHAFKNHLLLPIFSNLHIQ